MPKYKAENAAKRSLLLNIKTNVRAVVTDAVDGQQRLSLRMPHFKLAFTPSVGHEIQTECFVPLEKGYLAIRAVETLRDRITPHVAVTELRTIAADDLWLSMAYQRPSLAIHFTWKPEEAAVQELLPQIEAKLAPFDPRPHWAKVFTVPKDQLQRAYVRSNDFRKLAQTYDPGGKFINEFLRRSIL